jgi:Rrf2 family protein
MNIMNTTDCYRLSALVELARHYPAPVTARRVAQKRRIPLPYLAQLMRDLGQRGLVKTRRGPGGGLALARPAEEISLSHVLDTTVEPSCCPAEWQHLVETIGSSLSQAIARFSVADLASWEHAQPSEPDYVI